jgi:hypothetical protein
MFIGDGNSPNKEKVQRNTDAKQEKTKRKKVKKYQKNFRGPRSSRNKYPLIAIITKISRVIYLG